LAGGFKRKVAAIFPDPRGIHNRQGVNESAVAPRSSGIFSFLSAYSVSGMTQVDKALCATIRVIICACCAVAANPPADS